ncbi:30S ribosomal protein S3Ae [uncultured archaeon]|nr:30S ribosomal protein S3Ae [uncultured archaeon]
MAQKVEVINPLDIMGGTQKKDKADKPSVKAKRKGIDKWKKKIWHTILAPEEFERRPLGETVAEEPEALVGRTVTITGRELANQPKKSHIHLKFRVVSVSGGKAQTEVVGHEIKDGYMRRVVRRRASKVMSVKNYSSKDNKQFKVKTVIVTERKASNAQKAGILRKAEEITAKGIAELDSKKVVDELVFGTLVNKIFPETKRIVPIKRVEITSSKLLVSK